MHINVDIFEFKTLTKRVIRKFFRILNAFPHKVIRGFSFLLAPVLYVPFKLFGVSFFSMRKIDPDPRRIGEVAEELDLYVKMVNLGWRPKQKAIWLASKKLMVNAHYVQYWKKHITVISNDWLIDFFLGISYFLSHDMDSPQIPNGQYVDTNLAYYAVQAQWWKKNLKPVLLLEQNDEEYGWSVLKRFGIKSDDWFVCLHVREGGYFGEDLTSHHRNRNANISNYLLAIQEITDRGGWVIRMGDPTMTPLNLGGKVIDYANSAMRTGRMDVFLSAKCLFFIGNTSGPFLVAESFGVPCLNVNVFPITHRPQYKHDLYIPKLYWSNKENRYYTFQEAIALSVLDGVHVNSDYFDKMGVKVVENTPTEICEAVIEMIGRLNNSYKIDDCDQELLDRYVSLFKHEYFYTPSDIQAISSIALSFIKSKINLMNVDEFSKI